VIPVIFKVTGQEIIDKVTGQEIIDIITLPTGKGFPGTTAKNM
jgi:hypothetical protein